MTETALKRAPTERDGGPVLRRPIRCGVAPLTRPPETESATVFSLRKPAPVSRPAKTEKITELYSQGELTLVDPAELGRSIVLTVALPAFAVGCVVGMLL